VPFVVRGRVWAAVLSLFAVSLAGCSGSHHPSIASNAPANDQATILCRAPSQSLDLLSLNRGKTRPAELLATRDFQHFVDVTPRALPASVQLGRFVSGSCPNRSHIWVVGSTLDGAKGWLVRSSDGGVQWQVTRRLWTGSGGAGTVSFADVDHGFLTAGDPGSNSVTSVKTADGGATWSPVSVSFGLLLNLLHSAPSFANARTAFETVSSLPAAPGSRIQSQVMMSADGGSTWVPASIPLRRVGEYLFEQPRFFGKMGIVPVVLVQPALEVTAGSGRDERGSVNVALARTSDGGTSWTWTRAVDLAAAVQLGSPGATGADVLQGAPAVAVANPSTVWVAYADRNGRVKVVSTRDRGKTWASATANGLPVIPLKSDLASGRTRPVTIQAANEHVALISLAVNPSGAFVTYLTVDGGTRWVPFPDN
jgi:hypothetical protein